MNRCLVFNVVLILALSSCTASQKPAATPISEKPLSEMPVQPSAGIAGDDSLGDAFIPNLGNSGYDVQQYNIAMAFSPQLDVITATVTITSTVTLDNLSRLSLDFTGYQADGVQVGNSQVGYRYTAFYRGASKLYIDLPQAYTSGDELVVRVGYHGQVMTQESASGLITSLGLRNFIGHDLTYAMAEPDGAHNWFPCNDHPLDKAAYRFEITVPRGISAVANGALLQTIPSNAGDTFIWWEPDPMASYLATVVVGKYDRIDAPDVAGVKIRHYVIQGDFDFSTPLAETQDMLEYYSGLIGTYPFDEFGYVIILSKSDEGTFGMETQTMVMISRDGMLNPQVVGMLAHEMAHQWFGDSVSLVSWNEVWLKEGLAQYLMFMWLEHRGLVELSIPMDELEDYLTTPGNMLDQPLNEPADGHMYGDVYTKGAWVFHMLRQKIGDGNFTRFLQEYYQRFAGANASTSDLKAVAEQVSGQDLSSFFQQWVYGLGFPRLNVTWAAQTNGVILQVCQAGNGQVFKVPLEITLTAISGASQDQIVQVDESQEQVTYSTPFEVADISADPAQKLLADISVTQVEQLTGCVP